MKMRPRAERQRSFWARRSARGFLCFGLAIATVAMTGCGDEPSSGPPVTYVISEEFGGRVIDQREVRSLGKAPTVIRILQRDFDGVETTYGGRFVTKIAGVEARSDPPTDWLFYVNGREAEEGSADIRLKPGDHVQWDLHRWDASQKLTRTVGAFPRPLAGGPAPKTVALICRSRGNACATARRSLSDAKVKFVEDQSALGRDAVMVGDWKLISSYDGAPDLSRGPEVTGIFASFSRSGLTLHGQDGRPELTFGPGSGIVAAVERDAQASTWIVAGFDRLGTERAARLLNRETLQNRFAVAANDESVTSLPVGR